MRNSRVRKNRTRKNRILNRRSRRMRGGSEERDLTVRLMVSLEKVSPSSPDVNVENAVQEIENWYKKRLEGVKNYRITHSDGRVFRVEFSHRGRSSNTDIEKVSNPDPNGRHPVRIDGHEYTIKGRGGRA